MTPRVYIETTIPSFYHEVRTEPDMIARREWTRKWWDDRRAEFEIVTSAGVLAELENRNFPQKGEASALVRGIPLLELDEASAEILDAYMKHQLMPRDPAGDALHLACLVPPVRFSANMELSPSGER